MDLMAEAMAPDIRRYEELLLWGTVDGKPYVPPPPRKYYWGIIKVNGKTKYPVRIDITTWKAYETVEYKTTEIEIPSFEFIRWARGMDY